MHRVFLDANVLFSASYRAGPCGFDEFWSLPDVEWCTSAYAANEALRNAQDYGVEGHVERLLALFDRIESFEYDATGVLYIDIDVVLPEKDWPILLAALDRQCTHLLTGDKKHFGALLGRRLEGMLILLPSAYLHSRDERRR